MRTFRSRFQNPFGPGVSSRLAAKVDEPLSLRNFKLAALVAIVVGCSGLFALVTAEIVRSFQDGQNRERMHELAASTLHRAELAADYAFIALGELTERSNIVCSPYTVEYFRAQIYRRAIVKDIRVVDAAGNTLCSAFPAALGASDKMLDLSTAEASVNSQIKLMPLKLNEQPAFGVLWDIDDDLRLMAVVNTGTLVYDVLPNAFRHRNHAVIALGSGSVIASHIEGVTPGDDMTSPVVFRSKSRRYPLTAEIRINTAQVADWNNQVGAAYPIGGGILGLIFALLIIRTLSGPPSITTEIDRALAAQEFKPYAQAIYCLSTGRITGCEILARQIQRDGTVIPPYQFIPLAEQSGKIVPITWQIMDEALAKMRPFLNEDKKFTIAFNIVASQLMAPSFASELRAHVIGARVASRQITIELTERQEISNLSEAAQTIGKLKERGYNFAIDDAGTGHSGLSYIQKLGVDVIKIDKLFVDSIVEDASTRSLIKMLVRLAGDLGMQTVAEGIETEEQQQALRKLGVDKGQGFLVSRPLPLDEFLHFVEWRNREALEAPAA